MQILQKRLDKLLFLTPFVKENQGFCLGFGPRLHQIAD
jgi:hypothetical protein